MSRLRSLAKNTGILMAAKAATQVINFLLLPIYTSVLSTTEYGEVDLYVTASMILVPFLTLQLEQAAFRYLVGDESPADRSRVISSAAAGLSVVFITLTIIYIPFAAILNLKNAVVIYLFYASQALMTALLQIARGLGDNVGYGIASVITTSFSIIFSIVFVAVLKWSVPGALLGYILGYLASTAYLSYRERLIRYLHINQASIAECKKMMRYSVPLIFNQVSSWAINYSDRLVILLFLGPTANGIYAVAAKISNALNTILGVFNLAWTENAVLSVSSEDYSEYTSNVIAVTMRAYLCLNTLIICGVPLVFPVLVGPEFREAYWQIPILLIGVFFSGMAATLGSVYIARERTASVGITTSLSGVINVVLNLALVQLLGLYAASIATLVAFAMLFLFRYMDVRRFQRIEIRWREMIMPSILLAASIVPYQVESVAGSVSVGLVSMAYYIILVRKEMIIKHKGI